MASMALQSMGRRPARVRLGSAVFCHVRKYVYPMRGRPSQWQCVCMVTLTWARCDAAFHVIQTVALTVQTLCREERMQLQTLPRA